MSIARPTSRWRRRSASTRSAAALRCATRWRICWCTRRSRSNSCPGSRARLERAGVELRGCPRTCAIVPGAKPATDADWDAEYHDLILAIKVVDSLDEALAFIAQHGSKLADAIVTGDRDAAARFEREVDSATRLRQRFDALHRRFRVRFRRRDRNLDQSPPRARTDGPARADDLQVSGPRHRPDSEVTRN